MRRVDDVLAGWAADDGDARRDEPLRDHSRWRIGGPADWFVEPRSANGVAIALRAAFRMGVPVVVIGHGSNLLFDDGGVRGLVLKVGGNMSNVAIDGTGVRAQAGVWMPKLARMVGGGGLTGLEHTIGIPGTMGGLIVMNGGSRGRSIGDVIRAVDVVDPDGRMQAVAPQTCEFSYRRSVFQTSRSIIVSAELQFQRGCRREIRRRMLDDLRERRRKFPLKMPNCGSVFVRGVEMYERFGPPGKVIEDTGLKGLRVGDAEVSRVHANFIVNRNRARASDVLELIRLIRGRVHERTGTWMECEVRHVASTGEIRAAHELA